MSRLENVIEQVKASRTGKNHAWIFDDGKISNNVVCGEVLDLLEELKEYVSVPLRGYLSHYPCP